MDTRAGNFVKCGELNKERKRLPALMGGREIPVSLAAPPPEASSPTSGPARAALDARLGMLRAPRTSAQHEGAFLPSNIKFAKADALCGRRLRERGPGRGGHAQF